MKVSELFPKKYASGADLQNKPVTLTISRVVMEEMRPNQQAKFEQKAVVYFEEAQKGIILSSQKIAYQIAGIAGTQEMNDWSGIRVTLYPVPMQVAGQARIAIRARKPSPQSQAIDSETGKVA